jgi:hypothetical protein
MINISEQETVRRCDYALLAMLPKPHSEMEAGEPGTKGMTPKDVPAQSKKRLLKK